MAITHVLAAVAAVGWLSVGAIAQQLDAGGGWATRVAVLHVGIDDEEGGRSKRDEVLNLTVPVEEYARAADELQAEGADIVVLRMNSIGGLDAARPWLDLLEASYRPRFRVVAWVQDAVSEAGLVALSVPDLYMTKGASLGGTASPPRGTPKDSVQIEWLKQGARAAAMGGRPLPVVRAAQSIAPLSMSIVVGERRYFQDVSGDRLLNPAGQIMVLDADRAVACGVSLGTADGRDELVKAMGLGTVEWVGADVDRRVQERCDAAGKAVRRAVELSHDVVDQSKAMKSTGLSVEARAAAQSRRAKSWEELSALRQVWPGVSERWCVAMEVSWEEVAEYAKSSAVATRVAVLNIGREQIESTDRKQLQFNTATFSVSALVKAADELKAAGADIVVLRINEGYGCGTEAFIDALEKSFIPSFRTVGWVASAIDESGVVALAMPEVCMTPEGYWGQATCHVWNRKTCDALVAHAAAVGKRPLELARAFVYSGPLSMSIVDGRRTYRSDAKGEVVLASGGMSLNARLAETAGVSIGTAATREELTRVLGLTEVEWVGGDVDARLQAKWEQAAHDLKRVQELMELGRLADGRRSLALTEQRRAAELVKRDTAWAEIQRIRGRWPDLAAGWPVWLVTSGGWGVNWDATWADVAREVGVEETPAVAK